MQPAYLKKRAWEIFAAGHFVTAWGILPAWTKLKDSAAMNREGPI